MFSHTLSAYCLHVVHFIVLSLIFCQCYCANCYCKLDGIEKSFVSPLNISTIRMEQKLAHCNSNII